MYQKRCPPLDGPWGVSLWRFEARNAEAFDGLMGPLAGTPWALPALAFALVLVGLLLARLLRDCGFSRVDALLLAVSPLLVAFEADLWKAPPSTTIAINAAGFLIPTVLALKFLVQGRAHRGAVLAATVGVTLVAYLSSYAIPSEGVLLYYRVPALAAAGLAILFTWGRWREAGHVAYASGALGVIIGADFLHLNELMAGGAGAHRIILGGAGVLDGIFLVGMLSVFLVALAASVQQTWQQISRPRDKPTPSTSDGAGAPPPARSPDTPSA